MGAPPPPGIGHNSTFTLAIPHPDTHGVFMDAPPFQRPGAFSHALKRDLPHEYHRILPLALVSPGQVRHGAPMDGQAPFLFKHTHTHPHTHSTSMGAPPPTRASMSEPTTDRLQPWTRRLP